VPEPSGLQFDSRLNLLQECLSLDPCCATLRLRSAGNESQPADVADHNPQYLNPRFTMFAARAGSSLLRGRERCESGMDVADFRAIVRVPGRLRFVSNVMIRHVSRQSR
jgi:hypothetical protein